MTVYLYECPNCGVVNSADMWDNQTAEYLDMDVTEIDRLMDYDYQNIHQSTSWWLCPNCDEQIEGKYLIYRGMDGILYKDKMIKCANPHCKHKGEKFPKSSMHYIEKLGYVCSDCFNVKGYSEKNKIVKGIITDSNRGYSIEFETNMTPSEIYKLLKYGFINTSDGSIQGYEWKSPIYYSTKILFKHIDILNEFSYTVTKGCGTHLHVELKNKKRIYSEDWVYIFNPLIHYLYINRENTIKVWGRFFNTYATADCTGTDRYEAFSLATSTKKTIEFRLPMYKDKEQYKRIVRFAKKVAEILDRHYSKSCGIHDPEELKKIGRRILLTYKKFERKALAS